MNAASLGQLLGMALFGLIVGYLAKRKNRNAWGWGIFGAITTLVGLIVLAFMPYKCPACSASLTNADGKDRTCPSCGSF
jgi:MFS family permease